MTLLEAIKAKDERAQNAACKQLYEDPTVIGKLYYWKNHYGISEAAVIEVLQNGMTQLFENILFGKFRGESKESTYLLSICNFMILSKFKKNSKDRRTDSTDNFEYLPLLDKDVLSDNPMEQQIANEEAQALDDIIAEEIKKMKENCREGLIKHYKDGFSLALVAEKVNLKNANMVKKLLYRCRKKLRETLSNNPLVQRILNL